MRVTKCCELYKKHSANELEPHRRGSHDNERIFSLTQAVKRIQRFLQGSLVSKNKMILVVTFPSLFIGFILIIPWIGSSTNV
jgi:hypothetical protein